MFEDLSNLLEITISECQLALIRKGEVIASGYNIDLDELRITQQVATDYLNQLEIRERTYTGIDTIKVGFNVIHGCFIQVSRRAVAI